MTTRKGRRTVMAIGAATATCALVGASVTAAGFQDTTYATATLKTVGMPAVPPVFNDQTAASALFLDDNGNLFVSGYRGTGDGNGGTPDATTNPTRVRFEDVVSEKVTIVEAAGSSNDFEQQHNTSFMALDSKGRVWTWGSPYATSNLGHTIIGRGPITETDARRADLVQGLPTRDKIIDIERTENQFLALDETGTMWSWGYEGENLPRYATISLGADTRGFPAASNLVTTDQSNSNTECTESCLSVTWHSIWGGNNGSYAVATNGLIYIWGYDAGRDSTSVPNYYRTSQRFPRLDPHANKVLFTAYPDVYVNSAGKSLRDGASYEEIVENMEEEGVPACSEPISKDVVDTTGCPVRQLGFSARAPRLLLQNGELYTWRISDTTWGTPFLGRSVDNQTQAGTPTKVLTDVNYTNPGISSVTALKTDGTVWGWGNNSIGQAIGSGTGTVVSPTQINVPATITRVAATQCATWAQATDGRMWAWGAGTAVGSGFNNCTGTSGGGRIYDFLNATASEPFGKRITAQSTPLIRVR